MRYTISLPDTSAVSVLYSDEFIDDAAFCVTFHLFAVVRSAISVPFASDAEERRQICIYG